MSNLETIIKSAMRDGAEFAVIDGQLKTRKWTLEQPQTKQFLRDNLTEAIRIVEIINRNQIVQNQLNSLIRRGVIFYPETNDSSIENAELLNETEQQFLRDNQEEVLFMLQYAAIWKHCPAEFPQLQKECEADSPNRYGITKRWFADCFGE
jgi:hypothetical protein